MDIQTFENEVYVVLGESPDIVNYVTKSSTPAQRKKFDIGPIYINAAVCVHCREYIRSKNRHDFVMCKCGKAGVDGGSWYIKRMGNEEDRIDIVENFIDDSEQEV